MQPKGERKDWKELARRAANEHDSEKLLALVEELNAVLAEQENELRRRLPSKPGEPAPLQREISRSLLFVDDEPSIRLTLPPLLQEHGFQVSVAANVPEALEAIKTNKFDVLICDLNIERKADGFEVMHALRQVNPDAVVVILTGYPAFETALEGIRIEIDDYVVKPADIDSMMRTIKRKLSARRDKRL
jgi:ActR/RegA family two-component response regulator